MGIFEVLTIIFVVLKLLGVIAWSWWVVLLPLIIPISFSAIILTVALAAKYSEYRKLKRESDEVEND